MTVATATTVGRLAVADAEFPDLDGATQVPDPGTMTSSPGEFAARWNAASEVERDQMWSGMRMAFDDAYRCLAQRHADYPVQIAAMEQSIAERSAKIQPAALELKNLLDLHGRGETSLATEATIRASARDLLVALGVVQPDAWAIDAVARGDAETRRVNTRAGDFPDVAEWIPVVSGLVPGDIYAPVGHIEEMVADFRGEAADRDLRDRVYGTLQVLLNSGHVELVYGRGYRRIVKDDDDA